jgi:hypothetical protein
MGMYLILTGCAVLMEWQNQYPDNIIEERLEELIRNKTGKDIDLSPITGKENKFFENIEEKNG